MIPEDVDLNQKVMALIEKCQSKGIIGINRLINGYKVEFKFKKEGIKDNKDGNETTKIGGALTGMGEEITQTMAGLK